MRHMQEAIRRSPRVLTVVLRRVAVAMILIAWGGGLVTGTTIMMNYQFTAGPKLDSLSGWPSQAGPHSIDAPTLVLFANPHCPCSEASLNELTDLLARNPGKINSIIYFYKPSAFATNWEKTKLWERASSLPRSRVFVDYDGVQARNFHALTSGETFVFAPNGSLVFHGGITNGRGQIGSNPGSASIASYIKEGQTERKETRVYGCSLFKQTREVTP